MRRAHYVDGPAHGTTEVRRDYPPTLCVATFSLGGVSWDAEDEKNLPVRRHRYFRRATSRDGTLIYEYEGAW